MDDNLAWLAAGLIFLWILASVDARAEPVDPVGVRCEPERQSVLLPAPQLPVPHVDPGCRSWPAAILTQPDVGRHDTRSSTPRAHRS